MKQYPDNSNKPTGEQLVVFNVQKTGLLENFNGFGII